MKQNQQLENAMSVNKQQKPIQRQGVASSYSKYKCQYKQKPILTKLNNDSGYPQSILNPSQCASPREKSNYIQQNKKNLKNFFKERIPAENILLNKLMKRQVETIDPKRVFQIKQMEFQLKNKARAKVSLQKQQMSSLQLSKQSNFEKVNANFHINDKNRQLKEKYGGKMNLSFYQQQNYRRGTQSHIGKRSKLLKKQAYDKVFGPDISSLSRTEGVSKEMTKWSSPPAHARAKSISLTPSPHQEEEHHKTLRNLITKMNDYKNKLQDRNQSCHLPPEDDFSGVQYESNLITMIKNMSKIYQGRNVTQGHKKIEKMQDLGKIYKDYYANLLNHKANRLNKRKQMIYQTICFTNDSMVQHYDSSPLKMDNQSMISANDAIEYNEVGLQQQQGNDQGPRHSVQYRFKLLKKTLVRWAALFYIYGIKRQNIFLAFKPNRQPYELEGSYAFFKCIKLGDVQSVKVFIYRNPEFIFETQYYGKSPLSYACINNQLEIADFLLEQGVNSDKFCNNNKTSLYYALQTRNVDLIKLLLQKGASPWSTALNPYRSMIKNGINVEEISNLFHNARKIYLGMQIQSTIHERKEFWAKFKHRIIENCRQGFGFYSDV